MLFFSGEGQKTCFKDLGVEEYEIVATLDDKTSDICQNMDGRYFKLSEYQSDEEFEESKHPRGKGGKFVKVAKCEDITKGWIK